MLFESRTSGKYLSCQKLRRVLAFPARCRISNFTVSLIEPSQWVKSGSQQGERLCRLWLSVLVADGGNFVKLGSR